MFTHAATVKPLIEYKIPDEKMTVHTADQSIAELNVTEYNQLFGVSLTHGIFYDPKNQKLVDQMQEQFRDRSGDENSAVKNFLNHPKNYFEVRYINKTCGYCLVANQNIPTNTVVGIYSGEMLFNSPDKKTSLPQELRAYDMTIEKDINLGGKKYDISLRALHYGDATRFAIHLPPQTELAQLKLSLFISRDKILTQNINYPLTFINGKPVRYYLTTSPIKKGDVLGINYGSGYWSKRGNPCLFVKNNETIEVANYNKDLNRYTLSKEILPNISGKKRKEAPTTADTSQAPPDPKKHKMFNTSNSANSKTENRSGFFTPKRTNKPAQISDYAKQQSFKSQKIDF